MNKAKHSITVLSYGLIACFAFSFLAPLHWIPALITHFYIQMSFIALLLTPFLIKPVKNYHLAFIMIMITVAGYAQTRLPMQDPWAMSAPPAPENSAVLKVAQYNKYHKNKPFDLLPQWLEENQIEVLVMQEVTTHDVIKLKEAIRPVLPYTLPPMPHRPGHAIVFSKYPLENLKIHKLCETTCYAGGIHFQITLPEGQNVSIYTVHTDTPIKNRHYQYQSEELLHTGKWIAEDHAKNILFIGDINSTPYSPPFKMFKELSGLNYQFYGLLPANTWPSFLMLPVLKIPIDHVLFSDALTLLDIHRGASHGSDHHSLIATFAVEQPPMDLIKNNIPNTLTLLRMLMIPLMVLFFYLEETHGSVVIFLCFFTYVIAAITDFFDGFFARKLNQHSAFGTFLDPISDKILVSVLLITLVAFGRITDLWVILVMLIFAREFLVSGMREYLGPKNITLPVTQIAKLKTTVQMVAIGFLILSHYSPYAYEIGLLLLSLATILTVVSGLQYFFDGLKHIKDEPTES